MMIYIDGPPSALNMRGTSATCAAHVRRTPSVRHAQIRFAQKHLVEKDARIEAKHVEIFSAVLPS